MDDELEDFLACVTGAGSSAPPPVGFELARCLAATGPTPNQGEAQRTKKNFSEALSRELAQLVANALRPHYDHVVPTSDGKGHETKIYFGQGESKRLDVAAYGRLPNARTEQLLLAVSIKTITARDPRSARLTKNVANREADIRSEVVLLREKLPSTRLGVLVVMPVDACLDGGLRTKSSFAHAIETFRHGRGRVDSYHVGLYAKDGSILFTSVESDVPANGYPDSSTTASFGEVVAALRGVDAAHDG